MLLRVRVLNVDCEECLAALREHCESIGHPHVGECAVVGEAWLEKRCIHGHGGIKLEPVRPDVDEDDPYLGDEHWEEISVDEDSRPNPDPESQPRFLKNQWRQMWPDTIDATKGIGYPAREVGRYGSHPQHDGSDDD